MNKWQPLTGVAQLKEIKEASFERPQLIFKHSISCGISAQVNHLLQSSSESLAEETDLHYLDLINYRSVSNEVAAEFGIVHQSPQVLLIKDAKVVYHTSHFSIRPEKILGAV
ncbi:MAG: bacillithiol system redox-active protein YtxJ [Bacteroidia bacterium]|nr:bacillithiol system redox-active protein YtxJ [Bacteroidia bacterium]